MFNQRSEIADPLKEILAAFSDPNAKQMQSANDDNSPIEVKLKNDIIDGRKNQIGPHALEALKTYPALAIINDVLLDGMKTVGERFGSGQMQLPFVLESAEAMKAAVKVLEPYIEKKDGYKRAESSWQQSRVMCMISARIWLKSFYQIMVLKC